MPWVSLEWLTYQWAPDLGSERKGPLGLQTVGCSGVTCQWVCVWWEGVSERECCAGSGQSAIQD